jgi:hypothetical protein
MNTNKKKKGADVTTTQAAPDRHRSKQLPTRVDADTYAAIKALADAEDRTVAKMGLILLREALAARKRRPAKGGAS